MIPGSAEACEEEEGGGVKKRDEICVTIPASHRVLVCRYYYYMETRPSHRDDP